MTIASNVDDLIAALRCRPHVEISEGEAQARAAGIGPYTETPVGPRFRSIIVKYSGPQRIARDPDRKYDPYTRPQLDWEADDERVRELVSELHAACRRERVDLWAGDERLGGSCWVLFSACAKWSRLAEAIRCARIRVLEWPGRGHEEVLERLMADATRIEWEG